MGSLAAILTAALFDKRPATYCCITEDDESAAFLVSDLEQVMGEGKVVLLPTSDHNPYDPDYVEESARAIARSEVLQRLSRGEKLIVVAGLDAVQARVPSQQKLLDATWTVSTGDVIEPMEAVKRLIELGFTRLEFAESPGDIALRGGILDVFPFAGEYPIRIEFFGDEVDSLREFDARSQRSVSRLKTARIVPDVEGRSSDASDFDPFFHYLTEDTTIFTYNEARFQGIAEDRFESVKQAYSAAKERYEAVQFPLPETRYLRADELELELMRFGRLQFGSFPMGDAEVVFDAGGRPQPVFNRSIDVLRRQIRENTSEGLDTVILCDSQTQLKRILELMETEVRDFRLDLKVASLNGGFSVPEAELAVYTDHQIFERYHRPTQRKRKQSYGGLTLREVQNLRPGDFVVHVDYGIGRFSGLHRITVRDKQQEAVKLLFRDEDVLYVNVNALYKLHKFSGKEGHQPSLTKLGTGQWERTKARTKKRVKDIARDLIKLYAQRKSSDGFAFAADSVWQRELEASFRYEDTPDQAATVAAVKEDMEQPVPMDRLVCGDVGFGKTEIAVRAAFKAVQDGKQVAVLVPTTILAAQHHETFAERLKPFPVKVEALSRFRTAAEQKAIVQSAERGEVDVLIGTHRLVSKDVKFKDLGLLIIDEEQRFGVAAKERLRQLRAEVDTLTLTATPIPRTLQFSLMGARDLSIINTPPPNRQPIITEIHGYNKDLIRDAIQYEVTRGGQAFFIHNRVKSIEEVAAMLRGMLPEVRMQTAHGQMKASQLETVMADFIDHKFDVLISTNIIENGLDISNANTIIINHADRFGLSELHQLRGRVGRADRKAFCYLLVKSVHGLTREARMRLQAVEEFNELGSGFNIAMRDLDIRGARDLSIINTPPPNRQPIITEIHGYNKDLIRDAIQYEVTRGGQAFFIHNRVKSIEEVAAMLRGMLPEVRMQTAHGQMKASQLETVMADFIDHKFDVLISTNIIENGLDISNANTIIINHADRFGLSELHQLRGRVGRADRKAFCYLLVKSVHGLTREARMRLQAVEEFNELGSGFNIAMRDLDIRGAGNMLGGEQSGFIDEVGFETYHQLLDEAVGELRTEEFADVFDKKHVPRPLETVVDVDEDALIPDSYLSNNVERLNVYRRISEAASGEALDDIRLEMLDRFGPVPEQVDQLLRAARLKLLGQPLRLRKVLYKNERLFLYPPSQEEDPYFYQHIFYTWLAQLNDLEKRYVLRDEKGKKMRAIVQEVPDLEAAIEIMQRLQVNGESIELQTTSSENRAL